MGQADVEIADDFEIEVTPEMIEAGKAVCDWDPRLGGEDYTVTNVFLAMFAAMDRSAALRTLENLVLGALDR